MRGENMRRKEYEVSLTDFMKKSEVIIDPRLFLKNAITFIIALNVIENKKYLIAANGYENIKSFNKGVDNLSYKTCQSKGVYSKVEAKNVARIISETLKSLKTNEGMRYQIISCNSARVTQESVRFTANILQQARRISENPNMGWLSKSQQINPPCWS